MYRDDTCILTARKVEFSWRSSPFSSPSYHAASLQQAWVRVKPGPGSQACRVSGLKVQHRFFQHRGSHGEGDAGDCTNWKWLYTEPETDTTIHVYTYIYIYILTTNLVSLLHDQQWPVHILEHFGFRSCPNVPWWIATHHPTRCNRSMNQTRMEEWSKSRQNTHMRHHMQRTNKWQIRCVCLIFSLGNKHQVSSFCLGLDSVHKTQCNTGSTVTTSIHKWFFKKQLDLEMVLSTTPWDAMDHSAFFSPQKSGKENDQRDANRGDAKDFKKRLVSASLGDRVRAEQNRLVPSSPEALPCTSEILPPQHLWTPNFFTSPDGEVGTGNLQKKGIMASFSLLWHALTINGIGHQKVNQQHEKKRGNARITDDLSSGRWVSPHCPQRCSAWRQINQISRVPSSMKFDKRFATFEVRCNEVIHSRRGNGEADGLWAKGEEWRVVSKMACV